MKNFYKNPSALSMKKFRTEADLRDFISKVINGKTEVVLSSSCRADICTATKVIEVKPILNRPSLDQACGQVRRYAYINKKLPVVAGLTPSNYDDSLFRVANSHKDAGIEVWYIDQMPRFQKAYVDIYGKDINPHKYLAGTYITKIRRSEVSTNFPYLWAISIVISSLLLGLLFSPKPYLDPIRNTSSPTTQTK